MSDVERIAEVLAAHALTNGAGSVDLAIAKADLDTAYKAHSMSLYLGEVLS